jgi:hypothetical protein
MGLVKIPHVDAVVQKRNVIAKIPDSLFMEEVVEEY